MSQIVSLFVTRLYRAALSEFGKPIDTAELDTLASQLPIMMRISVGFNYGWG